MTYYDDQESMANIAIGLMKRGWTVYGYKKDQSESMSDYWDPARWDGVAEKNGFVLLVGQWGTHYSGRTVKQKGFTVDHAKIEKLRATMNDSAASENEKEVCRKKIETMLQKEKESEKIIVQYPTYAHGNPKGCNWHLEKDGKIIAKGKGAYQCTGFLFGDEEKKTMARVNAFIDRIEKAITDNGQLEAIQKKIVKKVIKPVETNIPMDQFVENETVIKLVSSFTGGFHSGTLLQLFEKYTNQYGTHYSFIKLGKKYQQLKQNFKNIFSVSSEQLEKWLNDESIQTIELKQAEEITYKTVYKKTKRQQKAQESNLINAEVTATEENSRESKAKKSTVQPDPQKTGKGDNITLEIKLNNDKNGIELYFSGKPSEDVRASLKEMGFRWSRRGFWYAKQSQERINFAESIQSKMNDTAKKAVQPEQNKSTVQPAENVTAETAENKTENASSTGNPVQSREKVTQLEKQLKEVENKINVAYQAFVHSSASHSGSYLNQSTNLQQEAKRLRTEILKAKNETLPELFSHAELTDAQNARINIFVNKWKNNDKYTIKAVYKKKDGKCILHIVTADQNSCMEFYEDGSKGLTSNADDYDFHNCILLHDFTVQQDKNKPEQKEKSASQYPEINIENNDRYVIPQELIDREHSANWLFRSEKPDRNKEIQEYFAELTANVKKIIETTDNPYYIYRLKKTLQYYKDHYFENYVKRLRNRADSPSWAVTGRAGRNSTRDKKMNDRYDKLMREFIHLENDYKRRIRSIKNKIEREKKQKLKELINNVNNDLQFATLTKEVTYLNVTQKKRVYAYNDYWICKLWGCFRVFKGNEEIYSTKTTESLADAKKYVAYIVQNERDEAV